MVSMSRGMLCFVRLLEMLITSDTVSSELRRHSNPPRRKVLLESIVVESLNLTKDVLGRERSPEDCATRCVREHCVG